MKLEKTSIRMMWRKFTHTCLRSYDNLLRRRVDHQR